jgi:hypothetical protein
MGVGRGHARSALGGIEKTEKRGLTFSDLEEARIERVLGFPGSLEQALRHEVCPRRAIGAEENVDAAVGAATRSSSRADASVTPAARRPSAVLRRVQTRQPATCLA